MSAFEALREAYGEIADLGAAAAVLSWDQQTYMPPRGGTARGQQLATLSGLIHERFTSERFGELVHSAQQLASLSEDQSAYLRELQFARERSRKLPADLVKELALQESRSFEVWQKAKAAKDFSLFAPQLKSLVGLVRQKAECFGYQDTPWDALAQDYERGVSAAMIREFFTPLREATVQLLGRIHHAQQVDASFLDQKWALEKQKEFGTRVLRDMGFDMAAGRQDLAPHPFCTCFGPGDVRITTRYKENMVLDGLSSTIHEMGHALYDLGFQEHFARTPLADAPSLGIHESQSRFWEVRVLQSRPFWERYLPVMAQYFPGQLDDVTVDHMYRASNQVEPGFIRVEADEVTYNLHIIIRFELEVAILSGALAVEEIPEAWNKAYKDYLGLDVPNDAVGCLQDVHWAYGSFGYFPSYTFGNIYAAMLVEKMQQDIPGMWDGVRAGNFSPLLDWMRRNIHREGRRLESIPLIRKATGKEPSPEALIKYLNAKYAEVYSL